MTASLLAVCREQIAFQRKCFVSVDDFCLNFVNPIKELLLQEASGVKRRNRKAALCDSEIISILIAFHSCGFANFKFFYTQYVCVHLSNEEKLLLRKRSVIETVNDEIKNICHAEHTRHRSINGFFLNLMSAIAAYAFFPKKPSIKKDIEETNPKLIEQFQKQMQLMPAA